MGAAIAVLAVAVAGLGVAFWMSREEVAADPAKRRRSTIASASRTAHSKGPASHPTDQVNPVYRVSGEHEPSSGPTIAVQQHDDETGVQHARELRIGSMAGLAPGVEAPHAGVV